MRSALLLPAALLLATLVALRAADAPVVAGRLLYELPAGAVPAGWTGHGTQELADGVWQISENPAEHHAAAPKMQTPAQDLVAEFEWRAPTARSVSFRFDVQGGHLCNVGWTPGNATSPGRIVLAMQDYDRDQGPAKAEWLDQKSFVLPRDQWVKVRWEMIGGEVRVRIGDTVLWGQRDAIALPKTTMAFTATGGAGQVRGLKIWEAVKP